MVCVTGDYDIGKRFSVKNFHNRVDAARYMVGEDTSRDSKKSDNSSSPARRSGMSDVVSVLSRDNSQMSTPGRDSASVVSFGKVTVISENNDVASTKSRERLSAARSLILGNADDDPLVKEEHEDDEEGVDVVKSEVSLSP